MSQIYSVVLLQAFKDINEGRMGYVPTIKVTRHFFSGENLECHLDRLVLIQIII